MRTLFNPALGQTVSAIGFGCASWGSRISPRTALKAAENALSLGVNWFDVAPPYGDGEAEYHLGSFLKDKRASVIVCTKTGIPRPQISWKRRLARPLARLLISRLPMLRKQVRKTSVTEPRARITASTITTSVEESLKRLGTDYIDVLALHEPTTVDVTSDSVFELLFQLKRKGTIRAIAIAGPKATIATALAAGMPIDVAQMPAHYFDDAPLIPPLHSIPPFTVTYSAFSQNNIDALRAISPTQYDKIRTLLMSENNLQDITDNQILAALAFLSNRDGVVISSMYSAAHISENCKIADWSTNETLVHEIHNFMTKDYV